MQPGQARLGGGHVGGAGLACGQARLGVAVQLGGGGRGGIQYGQALGQGQGFAPVAGGFGGHQHVRAVQALLGNGGGGLGGADIGAAGAEHVGLPDGAHASGQAPRVG